MSVTREHNPIDIKQVPKEKSDREAVRRVAAEVASDLDDSRPPIWSDLRSRAQAVLDRLDLSHAFLGYAMVAVSNAFWKEQFAGVPMSRRLLLLPHCLSDRDACPGHYDSIGLHCQVCGACDIGGLKERAERLGYHVITAEGTTSVIMKVLEGNTDAVLGVACLDSLEKSYSQIVEFGIPQVAVPLVKDGCTDTEAEVDEIISALELRADAPFPARTRTYLPLYRETARIFDDDSLARLLAPYLAAPMADDRVSTTGSIALDWLKLGGKRLRPFVTATAYAVTCHGLDVLKPEAEVAGLVPDSVRRLALAIEALHKASLVHDDIEDDDEFRYGRRTIHREHGIAPAINIGDYLMGLGYRLIAGESGELGAECVSDILSHLSAAHLDLCRGQGAELMWQDHDTLKPIDALSIYALKTAPAFEVALYAGLRAAGANVDNNLLRRFCTYIGEGYQVLNDLDEWRSDGGDHSARGMDTIKKRPALLRAFAVEAGGGEVLDSLLKMMEPDASAIADAVRELYTNLGAFGKAERLLEKLRVRALDLASAADSDTARELMAFLVRVILPHRSAA